MTRLPLAYHRSGVLLGAVRRPLRDPGPGPPDARLEALGRDRPDRRGQRDRGGAADGGLALALIAQSVATAHGATVQVSIERGYPVTVNDPALTERMLPTLERIAPGQVRELPKVTGSEDFSFFANRVPGLFVMVGVTPADQMASAASNHSPLFYVDEGALPAGARALALLAAGYLQAGKGHTHK